MRAEKVFAAPNSQTILLGLRSFTERRWKRKGRPATSDSDRLSIGHEKRNSFSFVRIFSERSSSKKKKKTNSVTSCLSRLRLIELKDSTPLHFVSFRFVSVYALSLRYAFRHNIRVLFAIFVNSFARCFFYEQARLSIF